MGKGDRKTRKGKIWRGSYGKTRTHTSRKTTASTKTTSPARKKR